MKIRLQKFLADAGIASRRKCERYIEEGLVSVNKQVVTELGTKINTEEDLVMFRGKIVEVKAQLVYFLLNKPVGYITSVTDPQNRKTVLDLMDIEERVFPVGRLDYQTSGLLIITNDGELTYRLTHPKHQITKTYVVRVAGRPTQDKISQLRKGVDLGIYKTSEAKINLLDQEERTTTYEVMIHEGKNRQIRRMFEFIKHPVVDLERVAIGKIGLKDLEVGHYRPLTKEEISYLKQV